VPEFDQKYYFTILKKKHFVLLLHVLRPTFDFVIG